MRTDNQRPKGDSKIIQFPKLITALKKDKGTKLNLAKNNKHVSERINEAFKWAFESIVTEKYDAFDSRQSDFEYILDTAFYKTKGTRKPIPKIISNENLTQIIEQYHELWFMLWIQADDFPNKDKIYELLSEIKSENFMFTKFISDKEIEEEGLENIDEYMKERSESAAVYDTTLTRMYDYNETYCSEPGWILTSSYSYSYFPPVSIILSLTALVTMNLVSWSEEKLMDSLEWAAISDPAISFFNEDMFLVTRYEPKWQENRVCAVASGTIEKETSSKKSLLEN